MNPKRRGRSAEDFTKRELLALALTDALTGLPNRRAIDEALGRAWSLSLREHSPLSLGIVDIDLFKSFNDRYGHQAGDLCLKKVAASLLHAMRECDFLGRYGGEEFLALLPGSDMATAKVVAERMREAVGSANLTIEGFGDVLVSVSIGIAQYDATRHTSFADLVSSADEALYAAKRSGRNRVAALGECESLLRELSAGNPAAVLPRPRSELVGRAREVEAVEDLLSGERLVTLVGPGGIGKTRLALAVASQLERKFKDGAFFFELTELEDPESVPVFIAQRFGIVRSTARDAADALGDLLRDRQALIVIDNCEHLIAGVASFVDRLLSIAPRLFVLATSREALDITDEFRFTVAPLSTESALTLFAQRARRVSDLFKISDHREILTKICDRLDGIPLAIELAASRMRVMSPDELLRGISERFDALSGASRTLPSRHQTIAALYEWSYQSLNDEERRLFRRLGVFSGGWNIEAVVATCDVGMGGAAIDLLTKLVDKSLVGIDTGRGPARRFRLLESARTYALDRLHESGEYEREMRRHTEYFAGVAAQSYDSWQATPTALWLPRYGEERENFLSALRWSLDERRAVVLGAKLARDLAPFAHEFGSAAAHVRYLDRLLSSGEMPAALVAESYLWAARLLGDLQDARSLRYAQQALAAAGDERTTLLAHALTLVARGMTDRQTSENFASAEQLLNEACAIYREFGDAAGEGNARNALGAIANFTGRREEALAQRIESLRLFRSVGKSYGIGQALGNIGSWHYKSGDLDRAALYYHEALVELRRIGSNSLLDWLMGNLAEVEMARGNLESARVLLHKALQVEIIYDRPRGRSHTLGLLARLAHRLGKIEEAAELLGFADAAIERLDVPRQPTVQARLGDLEEHLRVALGDLNFEALYRRGGGESEQGAIAIAEAL
uniref:GGDEF domain-containing protein n=1 Tax=mine drainage metagenome TaxID=410659 RepID=E6Q4L1_9ZZZZ